MLIGKMIAFAFLAMLSLAPQDRPPEKCSVSGTVVDSVTGRSLDKVTLLLRPLDSWFAAPAAFTTSDQKGNFSLSDLEPGAYRLVASRSGYLEMSYGARRPESEGAIVRLEAGQSLADLLFKLTPGAVVAGLVRDGDGEPLEGARAVLIRIRYESGGPLVERHATTETDDRGEYRFHGLPAGKYYLAVVPKTTSEEQAERPEKSRPVREASITTIYPAVDDLALASPIDVSPARTREGIDLTLLRSRVFRVSGRVIDPPAGRRVMIEMEEARTEGLKLRSMQAVTKTADGGFEFRGVAPGTYYLSLLAENRVCRAPVVVGSADVDGIRLDLSAGATIRMQIAAGGDKKTDLAGLELELTGGGTRYFLLGSYGVGSVRPDRYRLQFSGKALDDFYVKAALAGETDALAEGLTVSEGAAIQISVVPGFDGAKVEGIVQDEAQQPVPSATVVLVPEARSRRELFRTATTDRNGHYEFPAIAPGDYKILAWEDPEPGIWNDPDFLKQYEKQGEKKSLDAGSRSVVNVRLAVRTDQER